MLLGIVFLISLSQKITSNSDRKATDAQYFIYKYSNEDNGLVITNLTDEGKQLKKIVIPEMINGIPVTGIETGGINSCFNVTSIKIPKSLINIKPAPFFLCPKLKKIIVALDNSSFHSKKGILYCNSIIVSYPGGAEGDIKVLPHTTIIGYFAFAGCVKIRSITIPQKIQRINDCAFFNCENLLSITLQGEKIPTLGEEVFTHCPKLKEIRVPTSIIERYKSAEKWKSYADIIIGY